MHREKVALPQFEERAREKSRGSLAMKHNLKITAILLAMFLITQFIGLYVVNHYANSKVVNGEVVEVQAPGLPFGLETPELKQQSEFNQIFISIIVAFVIAIVLLFVLIKFKVEFIMKLWFFVVVTIALSIALLAILPSFKYILLVVLIIAIPVAFLKIYKTSFLIHNLTELLIYPGIAAVFVPILNIYTIVVLLILISVYDMWAVWHSGIMQKMAKYQINKLKVFGGFFVPTLSKKQKAMIKKMKATNKKDELGKKKFKVNVAILGGGDVIFPIIAAGVMLKTLGIYATLLVTLGAFLGLTGLFFFAQKKKFYPAMPFISAGIFVGVILSYLIF